MCSSVTTVVNMAANGARPNEVGILAMDVYFPKTYVAQEDLEKHDGVSQGKYTAGLGQANMAFCDGAEDINSVCLTAVHNLMDKYGIKAGDVGRLEVGTETMVDKSKAVKTSLMRLFQAEGNFDIEGIDNKNACYGGTAALFNSIAWMESSNWDGRFAIVVAGDIAVYAKGPARPTGGAGVVAMLVGPNAPIVVDPGLRSSHFEDVYDFYKPTMCSEYPRVDGHLSNECYLRALDSTYNSYAEKFKKLTGNEMTLNSFDYAIFHAPYNKLVQKSFGRLMFQDYLRGTSVIGAEEFESFREMDAQKTYSDKNLMKLMRDVSAENYGNMVKPTELITKNCGNSYCGSLYAGLLSLIANEGRSLKHKRALMFSYGSGLAASMFSVSFKKDVTDIQEKADVKNRLESRHRVQAEEFEKSLTEREETYTKFNYQPSVNKTRLFPNTYYVSNIDDCERRFYTRAFSTSTATPRTSSPSSSQILPASPSYVFGRNAPLLLRGARRIMRK